MLRVNTPTGQEVIDILVVSDDEDEVIEYQPQGEVVEIVSDREDNDVEVIEEEDDVIIVDEEEPYQNFRHRSRSPNVVVIEDEDEEPVVEYEHRRAILIQEIVIEDDEEEEHRANPPEERISPVPMDIEEEEEELHRPVQNLVPLEVIDDDVEQEEQAPPQENLDLDPPAQRPNTPEQRNATPRRSSPKRRRVSFNASREEGVLREPRPSNNISLTRTPEHTRQRKRSAKRTPQRAVVAPAGMAPTPESGSRKRRASGSGRRDKNKTKSPEDEEQEEEEDLTAGTEHERTLLKRPFILVIDKNLKSEKRIKNRVIRVKKYEFKIPKLCTEAQRGGRFGRWNRDKKLGDWPGVPNRKFSGQQDNDKYGQGDQEWPVQGVYEGDDPETYKVLYEGWTNESISDRPIAEVMLTAPEHVQEMKLRNEFYLKMREIMVEHRHEFNDERMSNRRPENIFWLYLDLSYFHSMKNKEYGMAPIWYMHIMKSNVLPPRFGYTPLNILNAESYEILKERKQSMHWDKLKDKVQLCIGPKNHVGPCQNGKGCKCNARYTVLYGEANDFNGHRFSKNIIPREDGTIDVTQFRLEDTRVIMECSDVCGCDSQCPRRQLQRGQVKPLVVFYENHDKGFGVRAAANFKSGEFICEYTGIARCQKNVVFDRDEHAWVHATTKSPKKSRKKGDEKEEKEEKKRKITEEDFVVKPYEEEKKINKRVWGDEWKKRANDMSYEARFNLMDHSMVISANSVGNIARFINHSCDSNTAFMEVFSRRYETDVLVPRIAVYAIRDIEIGEEVTTNYYSNSNGEPSSIKCHCGTDACKTYLPEVAPP